MAVEEGSERDSRCMEIARREKEIAGEKDEVGLRKSTGSAKLRLASEVDNAP